MGDFNLIKNLSASVLAALALTGCATGRPEQAGSPAAVAAYGSEAAHGAVDKTFGPVRAVSCYRSDGKDAGEALALSRLQVRAATLGANAVIDVRYDTITDIPKSPCWRRTVVHGVAVVLQPTPKSSAAGG
jgi:hypothetical protein